MSGEAMDGLTTEASLKLTGRSRLGRILRNKFVAGLIILIPIVLTVKGLWWLFSYVDGLAQPLAVRVLGRTIWGVGIVITVGVVFLTGFLFSKGPLKHVLDRLEDLLDDVPLVGTVYGTTKKVLSGFGSQQAEQAFQSFVFAQLPGRTTPGFLMKTFELTRRDGKTYRLCSVYVPTNHLYVGDVVILPEDDVIETDLTVEDGVGMILSAGASVPERIGER